MQLFEILAISTLAQLSPTAIVYLLAKGLKVPCQGKKAKAFELSQDPPVWHIWYVPLSHLNSVLDVQYIMDEHMIHTLGTKIGPGTARVAVSYFCVWLQY